MKAVRKDLVSRYVFFSYNKMRAKSRHANYANISVIKIAALTFDCVRGTDPVYLKQVICPVSDLSRRSLRSAGRGDLFVSRANTSIGKRTFSIAVPVAWNALPPDLRSPHNSRRQFRSKLKTHLFRQAYNTAAAWLLCELCWTLLFNSVEEWNSVTVTVS